MNFSIANFLFGMIPVISVLVMMVIFKVPKKWFKVVMPTLLLITAFYSFNTYGPRNSLSSSIPKPPEAVGVEKGKEMIEEVDRRGMFDQ